MPIKKIVLTIEPPPNAPIDAQERVLTFMRDTKQWVSNAGGLYPNEVQLIGAIDKARNGNPV